MEYQKDIIVADRLGIVSTDSEEEYLAHLLCLKGTCRYRFNERDLNCIPETYPSSVSGKCWRR